MGVKAACTRNPNIFFSEHDGDSEIAGVHGDTVSFLRKCVYISEDSAIGVP